MLDSTVRLDGDAEITIFDPPVVFLFAKFASLTVAALITRLDYSVYPPLIWLYSSYVKFWT